MLRRFWAFIAVLAACAAVELHAEQVVTQPIRTFGLGTLRSAAYSPDGRYIATCGIQGADEDTAVRIMETAASIAARVREAW